MSMFRTMQLSFVVVSGVLLAGRTGLGQTIVYVDDDASTSGDGQSWATAYDDLQDALAEASTNGLISEIRVAGGTYRPDCMPDPCVGTNGSREATFQLLDGVAIKGGYRGLAGGGDPDDRDIEVFETTLSGDLKNNDGPDFANNGENSLHVLTADGTDETPVLDGLTISAGNTEDGYGAGMFAKYSTPAVTDCTFTANSAKGGGAIRNWGASPTLTNCSFIGNRAAGFIPSGGAIKNHSHAAPVLTNCIFIGNTGGSAAGAIHCFDSSPSLIGCVFEGNSASNGGAIVNESFGDPVLIDCTFTENSALSEGGAIQILGGRPMLVSCVFMANTAGARGGAVYNNSAGGTWIHCQFNNNTAVEKGGAMRNDFSGGMFFGDIALTNCTFSNNSAAQGGGISLGNQNVVFLANNVLWGNSDDGGMDEGAQIDVESGTVYANYNCVQGWTGGLGGAGNIGDDPLFADPDGPDDDLGTWEDNDYHLAAGSPCIDAGDNDVDTDAFTEGIQPLPSTDLDGNSRFVDDPDTTDTGNGTPPIVDMGPYELQEPGLPIPAMSQRNLVIMGILLIGAGTLVLRTRRKIRIRA